MKNISESQLSVGDVIKVYGQSHRISRFDPLPEYTPGMSQETRIAVFEDGGGTILYKNWSYLQGHLEKEGGKHGHM